MKLRKLQFQGFFEDKDRISETLQIVEPEGDLEKDMLQWSILAHGETVTEDDARPDYAFNYDVGEYLGDGLYKLTITARNASDNAWQAEIAAAMVSTAAPADDRRDHGFAPFWFLSDSLHFQTSAPSVKDKYGGPAYGHLAFSVAGALPHDRLFRATA